MIRDVFQACMDRPFSLNQDALNQYLLIWLTRQNMPKRSSGHDELTCALLNTDHVDLNVDGSVEIVAFGCATCVTTTPVEKH